MFKNQPRSYLAIRELADHYSHNTESGAQEIADLLNATMKFVLETAPEYQDKRKEWIDDRLIKSLLDETANHIQHYQQQSQNSNNEALKYCKDVIKDQLDLLQNKQDSISLYYSNNDNALKSLLNESDH